MKRERILKVFGLALLLYVVSSLLTFSWKEVVPPVEQGLENLNLVSFWCKHPFGMPFQIGSWDMHCIPGQFIILGQIFNYIAWFITSLILLKVYWWKNKKNN